MCVNDNISMATLLASLSQSFKHIPPESIHALLDCVLTSTAISPSTLFDLLIDDFPNLTKDVIKEEKSDSDSCSYIASLVAAFCYLLKKFGYNHDALQCFVWRVFIPLMKMVRAYDSVMLNKIVESFFDVVINTNAWDVLEGNIVPFSLRSVGCSMGMLQNEESDVIKWVDNSVSGGPNSVPDDLHVENGYFRMPIGQFPLPLSCHLLSLVLAAALQSFQGTPAADLSFVGDFHGAKKLATDLLWDLCNMVERLLLQSVEHRSCAENFLLPAIFKAFETGCSFKISISGQIKICTRTFFLKRIWRCCKKLFSIGSLERRDAYSVLSLYLSFFSVKDMNESDSFGSGAAEFDITSDKTFWDEIKRGLVDVESLVRKQSLHILKKVLSISVDSEQDSSSCEKKPKERRPLSGGITKKDRWADKEARSLGVGRLCGSADSGLSSLQQWEAFLLLYEMLEEYGTHLVEAAWSNQISLLLESYLSDDSCKNPIDKSIGQTQMGFSVETIEVFSWLSVLWNRGFCHNNPLVRCMIMQSFLGIEWRKYRNLAKSVPESFILGPFMEGLNDPVHHKDFGVKGIYTSRTIEDAVCFLREYSSCLNGKRRMGFLVNLASVAKILSFGRAGLMGLAECIASSAHVFGGHNDQEEESLQGAVSDKFQENSSNCHYSEKEMADLLDVLRFIIESSRQHFNPKYRVRVCQKLVEAAASVMDSCDVPLGMLLHFVAAIPQEFTDYNGPLRKVIQDWLLGCSGNGSCNEPQLLNILHEFPERFIEHHPLVSFDDEDLDAWENQAKKWARVLFLVIKGEQHLTPISMFIQNHGIHINKQQSEWVTAKFLVLILSVLLEILKLQEGVADSKAKMKSSMDVTTFGRMEEWEIACCSAINDEFCNVFLSILGELVSFADASCSIFWSPSAMEDGVLPSSVRGKLGGPSQRRLSVSMTTSVLRAVTAIRVVASISFWCAQLKSDVRLNSAVVFLGALLENIISSQICCSDSETVSEIRLAAFEALCPALKTLVSLCSVEAFNVFKNEITLLTAKEGKPCLDILVQSFLQNINNLLTNGVLARSRRAVLLNSKWLCLESLLSIIKHFSQMELCQEESGSVRSIFSDLVESLENAGEDSVLPMLRSVRLALEILSSQNLTSDGSSCNHVDAQMMWRLVNSCWILHISCNKRRVAPIAALLSSVLHSSVFGNEDMHENDKEPGPLKWFVGKLLEEGQKSPRTIRLAALHLTGLWLMYPGTIKYYIKELNLLTLYGSVAFDEDFEAELSDNNEAKTEVLLLAKSPVPELTEVFINTELYARVSVAVLFDKLLMLADDGGSAGQDQGCQAALESGKLFLLDLLDSVVQNNDLAKELYKKYSGIHRRKIRAWQMICVLSRFVGDDIVAQVSESLHLCLYRNNLPAVRQYLETFAINIYLRFPSLVAEQLVPILQNYDMRPQALSSYVFIAANIILHSSKSVQYQHLGELLPPIIPLLTSHHHSLRGFTQLLVHQVLFKVFPPVDSSASRTMPIESCSFENLKFYLDKNPDCSRLRSSMEGYLDAYNPSRAVTPAGIFVNRVEVNEFECVPTCLMDEVLSFLNDVREDLRSSMAKDIVTIRNESLQITGNPNSGTLPNSADKNPLQLSRDLPLDFQRKITLSKYEKDSTSGSLLGNKETYERLLEMEKEDELVNQLLRSRSEEVERLRAGRQSLILVASLIDRIPNLAGLARSCEVFKASGLAVADANIVNDKQFQLMSVTAEKWVPVIEVPVNSMKQFLERKKREGFSILGLEQTANSITLDKFPFPKKTVLVLGREKEGIPVDIIHILDACIEIPQLGVVRSLNVHVSGAIALWEYTRQQRSK